MTDTLVQILFGWQAIVTSVALSIAGIVLKEPALLVIAGFLCIPFAAYLGAGFRTPAVRSPLFQFGSDSASARQKILHAWLLLAPLVIIASLLAYTVLTP